MRCIPATFAVVSLITGAAHAAQPQSPAGEFGRYAPPERFSEQAASSFYLPMRDGTRLAVKVVRPARDGKPADGRFPVIWHHTLTIARPGGDTGPPSSGFGAIPSLTKHGYVVVQVARRGNGQSFGARRGYHDRNEAYDAYEITEWLARQPWSTGAVGVYGCSNTGDAAMHVLTVRPPHLKAVFAGCFSWNKYDAMRRGGIFAQWGTGPQRTIEDDLKLEPVDGDPERKLLHEAAIEHQSSTVLFDLWKGMPYRDSFSPLVHSRFWSEGSVSSYSDSAVLAGAALYIQGGWMDEFRDQAFIAYENLPGPKRVIVGPWLHCRSDDFALVEEAHRFFDAHLKGLDTGLADEPPIHYFTINAAQSGAWRAATTWPPASSRREPWYLVGGRTNRLARSRGRGDVTFTPRFDVACPGGGASPIAQPCHVAGAGVSFRSGVLNANTEVTGHPVADLWVSTTGKDTNVFVYLEDVAPDGTVAVVTEGRLKASLRATHEPPYRLPDLPWHRSYAADAEPLERGVPARLTFDLLPTSYVFRKGHRIQVTVTGADHRERAREAPSPPPTITVHGSADHASVVQLPIVAASN